MEREGKIERAKEGKKLAWNKLRSIRNLSTNSDGTLGRFLRNIFLLFAIFTTTLQDI